jgi:hypothetical protein
MARLSPRSVTIIAAALLVLGGGCSEAESHDPGPPTFRRSDGGSFDGTDAGRSDSKPLDADAVDARSVPDGGAFDGGSDVGPVDGGRADAARADAGGGPAALWPIAVGDRWTYSDTGNCPGMSERAVVSANPVGGRPAFQLRGCNGVIVDLSVPGGDEVDAFANAWLVLVDPILEDGHSWSYSSITYTWRREGTVTVPAGTYSDCWTAVASASSFPTNTYCRGVGPVHSVSDTAEQILTSTNL